VNAVHVGISERFDVVLPAAGGDGHRAGDYVFGDGRSSKLREGVWGLLRVLPHPSPGLRPLQGRPPPPTAATGPVCPSDAPVTTTEVTAVEVPLPGQPAGAAFVPTAHVTEVLRHPEGLEPLVLHVRVGDCLRVQLHNALRSTGVQLQAADLVSDPAARPVPVDGTGTVELWADPGLGESVSQLRDAASPLDGPARGLYGAVVVAAHGSVFRSPGGGSLPPGAPGSAVVVRPRHGPPYRDFTVFPQDSDGELGTHAMPYRHVVLGVQALSYGQGTQVLEAYAGDALRMHVVSAVSEQVQGFALDGHRWPLEPGARGTNVVDAQAVGAREVLTVEPLGGAGGEAHLSGSFVYGDTRAPYRDAGEWGVLRVMPSRAHGLAPLATRTSSRTGPAVAIALGGLLLVLVIGTGRWSRTRRADDAVRDGAAG
jgi:hypothetical protein